ncbi:MFS transporter [Oleomonas cavernae]|uniref:MFS transporter n=1 Tax=Oleomonas cavernae TaxID=2320859 RepID=A0A418WI92_9PROT|nr:MFS transporter [Oleomonas cavernae]RJF89764.1 MFS transporter [Oleomonas cavernae]
MGERGFGGLIAGLGLTMIMGYGALYYAFTVMAPALMAEFGWSSSFTYGCFSLGLLAGGLMAPVAGRQFDRFGVRLPMTIGSAAAALALAAMALVQGPVSYGVALVLLQAASTFVLYDAAFTGISQIAGPRARRVITALTLIAGFASTLFWPLTTYLVDHLGWRETYLVFAAAMFVTCVPTHYLCLAPADRQGRRVAPPVVGEVVAPQAAGSLWRQPAFVLLATSFCLGGFVLAVFPVYVLTILGALGTAPSTAIWVAALIGPAQVGARFIEMVGGKGWGATTVGLLAASALPVALAAVLGSGQGTAFAVVFALFYGAGQGLKSIAYGVVPLALFGAAGYGTLLGRLSSLRLIVSAVAPFAFAALVDGFGMDAALGVALAFAVASLAAYLALLRRLAPRPAAA